jgi:hypothetical protein
MGSQGTRGRRALIRVAVLATCLAAMQPARLGAIVINPAGTDIERALRLARAPTPDVERERFHSAYFFDVYAPPVDDLALEQVEIITEFRRIEIIGEEHARLNDTFGRAGVTGEVSRAIEPWRGRVTVRARLRLLKAGNLAAVPPITIAIDDLVAAPDVRRDMILNDEVLVGATIEASFEARSVGQATRTVDVRLHGQPLGSVRVDFGGLE